MSTWEQMLDELVRERGPALVRYAYLFTSNRTAAEDLVQDALTRCFSRDRTCPDGARAEGYVRRAIVTTYIDGYRKRRRLELSRHLMASRESLPAAQDDVAEQVDVRAGGARPAQPPRASLSRPALLRRPRGRADRRPARLQRRRGEAVSQRGACVLRAGARPPRHP